MLEFHNHITVKTQVLKFPNLKESVLKIHCWVPQYMDSIIYGDLTLLLNCIQIFQTKLTRIHELEESQTSFHCIFATRKCTGESNLSSLAEFADSVDEVN